MKTENVETVLEDKNKQRNILIITIVFGLLFGFFVGRMWSGKNAGEEAVAVDKKATTTSAITKDIQTKLSPKGTGMNALTLSEQVAGNVVSIAQVSLSENSWVVIHEDANGELGNILGAGWFPKGISENVSIELLRGTKADKKYYAILYTDDGDKKFDSKADRPITENGKDVLQVFMAK
jgi:hypothetical protein